MRKGFVVASFSVVSIFAAACGSSAAPGSGSDEVSSPRASEALAERAPSPRQGLSAMRAATLLDLDQSASVDDAKAKHALAQVYNVTDGTYTESLALAIMGGDGLEDFTGAKVGSADGCTLYATLTAEPKAGSAGVITVTNKKQTATLTPSGTLPTVEYPEASMTLLAGNVGISAAGGPDVGAFSGTQEMPDGIAGFTGPTSISRSAGWTASWTAATSSHMAIYVFGADETDGSVGIQDILRCQVADSGSFTVTSAALALFPSSFNTVQVALERTNEIVRKVGKYSVNLNVQEIIEGAAVKFKK